MFQYIIGYVLITMGYVIMYCLQQKPNSFILTGIGQIKLLFDFTTLYYFVKLFAEFRAQQKDKQVSQWLQSSRMRLAIMFVYFYICQAWLRSFLQDIMGPLYFSMIFNNTVKYGSLPPTVFIICYDCFNQLLEFVKSLIILIGFYYFGKSRKIVINPKSKDLSNEYNDTQNEYDNLYRQDSNQSQDGQNPKIGFNLMKTDSTSTLSRNNSLFVSNNNDASSNFQHKSAVQDEFLHPNLLLQNNLNYRQLLEFHNQSINKSLTAEDANAFQNLGETSVQNDTEDNSNTSSTMQIQVQQIFQNHLSIYPSQQYEMLSPAKNFQKQANFLQRNNSGLNRQLLTKDQDT
eukprot:403355928